MIINILFTKLTRGWEAKAFFHDFELRAQGSSRIKAKENVLSYVLEVLAEDINNGRTALADIFPLSYMDIYGPSASK